MGAGKRPSPSLTLLLAASAALVGNKAAHGDETGTGTSVGYRFNVYDEDAFSAQPVVGSPERYHVDSQQLLFTTNVSDRYSLAVNATHEVMSGSSPWYLLPGPSADKPIQIMSGASIHDHRSAVQAALTHDNGGNDTTTYSA